MIRALENTQKIESSNILSPEIQKQILHSISKILEMDVTLENLPNLVPSLRKIFNSIVPLRVKRLIAMALIIAGAGAVSAEDITDLPLDTTVSVNSLRLRQTPSLNGEIIDHLNTGDAVTIVDFDSTGSWALVDIDDDPEPEGFVFANYLNGLDNLAPELVGMPVLDASVCVVNGAAVDSGTNLCSTPYFGTTILYAHNWSEPGQTLLSIYQAPEGTVLDINIAGVNYGNYQVVTHYESSGQVIANILDQRALNSNNNEYITLVTTDPAREAVDPTARRVTLLQRVVPAV